HGWSSAFAAIKSPHVKYVCPTAKAMNVTLNAGMSMPSWFDIKSLSVDTEEDEKGIKASATYGGFSQGGAVALYSVLTSSPTLAGVLALSSWLPLHSSFPAALKGNNATPILQCHGEADPVVRYTLGRMTATLLSRMCTKHEFQSFSDLAHSSSPQVILI
ncbi:hypothetical protein QZH41_013889, partial [Actinostola sp. cb2023]